MSLPPQHAAVSSGTFQQPERAALLRGVALRVGPGRSLLLRGAAGAGKSALLRVLCGLWPMGEGLWPVAGAPREIGSPWPPHRRTLGRGDIERRNSEEQSPSAELSLACVPPLWVADARRAGAPLLTASPRAQPLSFGSGAIKARRALGTYSRESLGVVNGGVALRLGVSLPHQRSLQVRIRSLAQRAQRRSHGKG